MARMPPLEGKGAVPISRSAADRVPVSKQVSNLPERGWGVPVEPATADLDREGETGAGERKERVGGEPHGHSISDIEVAVADAIQGVAASGIAGAGQRLPYGGRIRASFGRHDVSGIRAHVGGAATDACRRLGAAGFATGQEVGFPIAPDLHTVAHEAAHVVQQRGGVHLRHGVGLSGDIYERHADAVAARVVAGQSAEGLLNDHAPPSSGAASRPAVVQADVGFEFQTFQSKSGFYRPTRRRGSTYFVKDTSHAVFAEGSGWQIENDGGDIEVVVERVPETKSGRSDLETRFGQINALFGKLSRRKGIKRPIGKKGKVEGHEWMILASRMHEQWDSSDPTAKLAKTSKWKDVQDKKDYKLLIKDDLKAHPQVTAGFKLDKLLEAFELLGKADYTGEKVIGEGDSLEVRKQKLANQLGFFKPGEARYAKHRETIREAVKRVGTWTYLDRYPSLKGFFTIVGAYILGWQKNTAGTRYAKNYTPIMSRTDLASVLGSLSPIEQGLYGLMVGEEKHLSYIMAKLGLDASTLDEPLFGSGGAIDVARDEYADPKRLAELGHPDEYQTVREFLQALGGKHVKLGRSADLSSQSYGPQAMGVQSGAGATDLGISQKDVDAGRGKTDPLRDATRKKGIAVELRRLRENVPLSEWKDFALAAFDLTVMVNESQDPTKDWG